MPSIRNGINASVGLPYEDTTDVSAKQLVFSSNSNGTDSGWLLSSSYPERFGILLTGTSAVVSLTGSNDAANGAAGYSITFTLDTPASTLVTPPLSFDYTFIKFTIVSLGASSSIQITRGV